MGISEQTLFNRDRPELVPTAEGGQEICPISLDWSKDKDRPWYN
jgi:hypothetical protein